MKKNITAAFAAILVSSLFKISAQHSVGMGAGNHNVSYSAFQNPANTYPDKNRLYLNVWGAQMGFNNNFLVYNAPFGLIKMLNGNYPDEYKNSYGNLKFDQDWVNLKAGDNNKLYYLNEVYGPSVFFRTSRRTAVGFGVNGISGLSVDGLGAGAAHILRFGLDSNSAAFGGENGLQNGVKYKNGAFSINADRYSEWFFSLAAVTKDRGQHFVKWGAAAKLLLGMGSAGLRGESLDYSVSNNTIKFSAPRATFYHTDDQSASSVLSGPLGLKFDFLQGAGAGMDLGFIYENRPDTKRKTVRDWWNCDDEKRSDYAWKFGASLTNLGFIAYNGTKQRINTAVERSWVLNKDVVNNYKYSQGLSDRFETADQLFFKDSGVNAGTKNGYTITTPATFNAQLDMRLENNFYVGLNWQQSLKGTQSNGLKKTSYIGVVPRWENEFAELGVPVTLTRDYTALNVGLYGRLGPLTVGTDNITGLASFIANGSYKSANLYFGLRFQIPACGWRAYEHEKPDTAIVSDTTTIRDTTSFWKRDTIIKEMVYRDTILIEKRDTVIEYRKLEGGPDLGMKEAELKRREAELQKKEEEIIKRENAVLAKEKTNSTDCAKRIQELEDQLKRERDLYAKLSIQYQETKDERDRLKISMGTLEREIASLKSENSGLKADVSGKQSEIIKLRQEIDRLKASNRPCDAQVKSLDSLLSLEEKETLALEKELSKQKAEIGGLKKENDDQKIRIAQLEAEIINLKKNCTDKTACDAQLKELQDKLNAEKNKSSGLEKQLSETKALYEAEVAKTKKLEEQLKNCGSTEEAAKLKAELEAQKKKTSDLEIKVKTLETENSTLKAKVSVQETEIADLKKKLDAANSKIKELELALKNCGSSDEIAALKAEIEALKKSGSEKDATISSLKSDKAKLESDLSTAKAKITDLEKQLSDCKSKDCKDIEAKLADYKSKYENQLAQYEVLYEEYNELVKERNQLKGKVSDLEAKLKNCSGSSEDISKLEAEIKKLKQTILELNGEVAGKQKSLDELLAEYDKVVAEKGTLQKQVTTLQGQMKTLQDQIKILEEKLKKCEEKVAPGGGE